MMTTARYWACALLTRRELAGWPTIRFAPALSERTS